MNICAICASPKLAQANASILAGASIAQTARNLRLNAQSLARHRRNGHVPPVGAPTRPWELRAASGQPGQPFGQPGPPTAATVSQPVSAYHVMKDALDEMLDAATSPTQRLAIIAEQRRLANDRARLVGPEPAESVRIQDVTGLAEFIADGMVALEDFPAARLALLEVLDRHDLGDWDPPGVPPEQTEQDWWKSGERRASSLAYDLADHRAEDLAAPARELAAKALLRIRALA